MCVCVRERERKIQIRKSEKEREIQIRKKCEREIERAADTHMTTPLSSSFTHTLSLFLSV